MILDDDDIVIKKSQFLTDQVLLDRGYTLNKGYTKRVCYNGKTNKYLDLVYINQEDRIIDYCEYRFSRKGSCYKVRLRNISDLEIMEKLFGAKNDKERDTVQKKLLKSVESNVVYHRGNDSPKLWFYPT